MILFLLTSLDNTYASPRTMYYAGIISFSWSFSYGVWLSIIFFANSQEAKRRWRALLFKTPYIDVDNRLVRHDNVYIKDKTETENIQRSMDSVLGGNGRGSFTVGRNRDSFGSNNGGNGKKSTRVSPRSNETTKGGTSQLAGANQSPVFTSHSAFYADSAEVPIDLDKDNVSPLHHEV